MVSREEQVCRVCGEVRPLTEFKADRRRPSGVESLCKSCRNQRDRDRRGERRDYVRHGWLLPTPEEREEQIAAERARRKAKERADRQRERKNPKPPGWKPDWAVEIDEQAERRAASSPSTERSE
jgi:hypothetical protein